MFQGPMQLLKKLSSNSNFSSSLKVQLTKAQDRIEKLNTFSSDSRTPLQLQAHKPVPIASYVPKFEEGYSLDKHYDPDVERSQAHKLQVQYKKEKKGFNSVLSSCEGAKVVAAKRGGAGRGPHRQGVSSFVAREHR